MPTSHHGDVQVFADTTAIAEEAARRFTALSQAAERGGRKFSVALSGGSTPRKLHQLLSQPPFRDRINWANTYIFWGDERFVAPDDEESNFLMARETLLAHVPLPAANIFPVPTVGGTAEDAARAYAETIVATLGGEVPRFELVLLGMGPDGHTASLFPGHPEASSPSGELVIAVENSPKPPPTRISFTYKLLNAADNIIFLVAGDDKAGALRAVLHGPANREQFPAQGIKPDAGTLTWLVDKAAAQEL